MAGLIVLTAAAVWAWTAMTSVPRETVSGVGASGWLAATRPDGAARALTARGLLRDPMTYNRLLFALSYVVVFCALPVMIGWSGLLPWTGPVFVAFLTALFSNLDAPWTWAIAVVAITSGVGLYLWSFLRGGAWPR